MATVAGILLGVYVCGIVYALALPAKQHDPQRGQAIGCLMIVVLSLLGVGGLLAVGVAFNVRWLVVAIFWLTVYPAVMLAAQGVFLLYKKLKRNA